MINSIQKGFTLIELMIVMAIIAILAAIAYPAYTNQVQKSNRGLAQTCALEYSQYLERYFTTNLTYVGADDDLALECKRDLTGKYTITASGLTATGYTVTVATDVVQASDPCGDMTLNEAGVKTDSDTTQVCW